MKGCTITLCPMVSEDVFYWWERLLDGLDPPEAAYGPEYVEPRPRAKDTYFSAHVDEATAFAQGRRCGDTMIGLVYTQRPAPTTMVFALGLLREYRGQGLGPVLRNAAITHCFADPDVWKVESEVYGSNGHSLRALHGPATERMRQEGRQRATICVRGHHYDRLCFGLTRPEWAIGFVHH